MHVPVLVAETIGCLSPAPGGMYIDATLGAGGHSRALLEAEPSARVLGIDVDPAAVSAARGNLAAYSTRFDARVANYSDIKSIVAREGKVDGIMADLGLSSMQMDDFSRGFSFRSDFPLDMRMSSDARLSASAVVNTFPEDELAKIFFEYGDEKRSRAIARAVVHRRKSAPFATCREFADIVAAAAGRRDTGIHPATKVFQSLRIFVNRELDNLDALLAALPDILKPGGRVAIISFHSKEDRMVKRAFAKYALEGSFRTITKKPVVPSPDEVEANPRSRSAKLRCAERI